MAVVSKNNVLIDQSMDVVHLSWASFKWTLYTDVVPVRWISSGWILSSSGLPVSVTQERTIVSVNQSCKCKWWSPGLTQHMRSGSTTTAEISTHAAILCLFCNLQCQSKHHHPFPEAGSLNWPPKPASITNVSIVKHDIAVYQLFLNYSSIHVRLDFILRPSSGNYCFAVVLLLFCWLHRFNICQQLIVLSIEQLTLAQWLDCLLLARVRVKSIK